MRYLNIKKLLAETVYQKTSVKSFIVSSVIVVVLFMLLFTALVETVMKARLKNNMLLSNEEYAAFLCEYIDLEITYLNNILYHYVDDEILTSVSYGEVDTLERIKDISNAKKMIATTVNENKLLDDIVVIFKNTPYVINKDGHFTKTFFSKDNIFLNDLIGMNTDTINSDEMHMVKIFPYFNKQLLRFDTVTGRDVMVFCLTNNHYTISLLIDYQTFMLIFDSKAQKNNYNKIVILNKDQIIYNNMTLPVEVLANWEDESRIKGNKETYLHTSRASPNFNLSYHILYPVSALNKEVAVMSTPYLFLYSGVFIIGILLILAYNKKIIRPLGNITSVIMPEESGNRANDEFKMLNNLIMETRRRNEALNEFVVYNKTMMLRGILENIVFNGTVIDTYDEESYFGEMNYSYFMLCQIIVIYYEKNISMLKRNLEDLMVRQSCYFQVFGDTASGFYMMINCNEPNDVLEELNLFLENINFMGNDVFAVTASPTNSVNDFVSSVAQIQDILSRRNINVKNYVFKTENIIWGNMYKQKAKNFEHELHKAITSKNTKETKRVLAANSFRQKNISFSEYRDILLNICALLEKIIEKEEVGFGSEEEDYLTLMKNSSSPAVNLKKEEVRIHEACVKFVYETSWGDVGSDRIIQYIKENHADFITLELVAQKFGMNPNYLSGYIKKQIGITFREFMDSLRIKTAKRLLDTTEMPVSKISEELKFNSSSSFIRFFRKMEGISPGAYRGGKNTSED